MIASEGFANRRSRQRCDSHRSRYAGRRGSSLNRAILVMQHLSHSAYRRKRRCCRDRRCCARLHDGNAYARSNVQEQYTVMRTLPGRRGSTEREDGMIGPAAVCRACRRCSNMYTRADESCWPRDDPSPAGGRGADRAACLRPPGNASFLRFYSRPVRRGVRVAARHRAAAPPVVAATFLHGHPAERRHRDYSMPRRRRSIRRTLVQARRVCRYVCVTPRFSGQTIGGRGARCSGDVMCLEDTFGVLRLFTRVAGW